MKFLTIISGILLMILGIGSIALGGMSFLSMAFPIGIVLMLVGIVECFAYRRMMYDEENRHWVLIEGLSTFVLGVVVLTGQLAADIAVPVVFGMWSAISGIRGLVVLTEVMETEKKDIDFYWMAGVSVLNVVAGLYTFFNSMLFNLSVLVILGVIFVIQGASTIKIGMDISYNKPELIKTRDEKIAEAKKEAREAKQEMKQAIKKARLAKKAVEEAEASKEFHEVVAEPVENERENHD